MLQRPGRALIVVFLVLAFSYDLIEIATNISTRGRWTSAASLCTYFVFALLAVGLRLIKGPFQAAPITSILTLCAFVMSSVPIYIGASTPASPLQTLCRGVNPRAMFVITAAVSIAKAFTFTMVLCGFSEKDLWAVLARVPSDLRAMGPKFVVGLLALFNHLIAVCMFGSLFASLTHSAALGVALGVLADSLMLGLGLAMTWEAVSGEDPERGLAASAYRRLESLPGWLVVGYVLCILVGLPAIGWLYALVMAVTTVRPSE
jgi:hypothetical protein